MATASTRYFPKDLFTNKETQSRTCLEAHVQRKAYEHFNSESITRWVYTEYKCTQVNSIYGKCSEKLWQTCLSQYSN